VHATGSGWCPVTARGNPTTEPSGSPTTAELVRLPDALVWRDGLTPTWNWDRAVALASLCFGTRPRRSSLSHQQPAAGLLLCCRTPVPVLAPPHPPKLYRTSAYPTVSQACPTFRKALACAEYARALLQLAEALPCKPESRVLDSLLGHRILQLT
jgi:hypothetical protein